jgi:hypothetical protein
MSRLHGTACGRRCGHGVAAGGEHSGAQGGAQPGWERKRPFACPIRQRVLYLFLAGAQRFWYGELMETNPFDLTPEQKNLLVALAQETGKPIPALIAEALDELQEHVHAPQVQHPGHGGHAKQAAPVPVAPPRKKHIWEIATELVAEIPEEDLARLPVDGAAQHDHYIYGTPKRTP